MKNLKIGFVAILILAMTSVSFNSCKKYEDGPGFTVLSAKARLSRAWVLDKTISADGIEIPATGDEGTLTFDKDGSASVSIVGFAITGTWEFTSGKDKISSTFNFFGTSTTSVATILKLTKEELWTVDADGIESHLKAK